MTSSDTGVASAGWRLADRMTYSPIVTRPVVRWPNDARIAVWFCPNVLFFEYEPLATRVRDTFYPRGTPDQRVYAHQDYANRIGFWRTLELADDLRIQCT